MDEFCEPACSIFGPFAYFADQYRLAGGRQLDRPLELPRACSSRCASATRPGRSSTSTTRCRSRRTTARRSSAAVPLATSPTAATPGFLVNSFDPGLELRHLRLRRPPPDQLQLAGRTAVRRRARSSAAAPTGVLNQLIGNWSIAGLTRWTSGFPFNVYNCRSCWSTNWNLQGNAMLVDPNRLPTTETTHQRRRRPAEPVRRTRRTRSTFFRRALPGEVGIRNQLRGDGYFTVDLSVSQGLQRWASPTTVCASAGTSSTSPTRRSSTSAS